MPPLPQPLGEAFRAAAGGGAKRERTQALLLQAAVQAFCANGIAGATMQEIARTAGVTTGTVYNHFKTKDELVRRLAVVLADSLCRAIADSCADIADAAQRMAIGQRRYIWLAQQSPAWALLLLEVVASTPEVLLTIQEHPLADLRLGIRQKKFKVPSEAAAMDAINGICTTAMHRVATGQAPANHDIAATALVLRALGMPPDDALEVARRPLPALAST